MVSALRGLEAATTLTAAEHCVQAIDRYLHERGAYRPYQQRVADTTAAEIADVVGALPEVGDD